MVVNISLPKSWDELSQAQLRFLFDTIAKVSTENEQRKFYSREDYAVQVNAQVAAKCLFEWGGIKKICPFADGWLVKVGKVEFSLSYETISSACASLSWLTSVPEEPVRLERIGRAKAVAADLSENFDFDSWLACETFWQQYQLTVDDSCLLAMAEILYSKEGIKLSPGELLSIFYWWSGVKSMVSRMFPNFFQTMPADGSASAPSPDDFRRNINAQIRALTKGDVTKEKEILSLNAIRALTELDAQALEYENLRKQFKK